MTQSAPTDAILFPSERARRDAVARRRLVARLAAVQALYQVGVSGEPPEKVVAQFLRERLVEEIDGFSLAEADRKLFSRLVLAIGDEGADLDRLLRPHLPEEWAIERVEPLLHIILRAAAFELSSRGTVPPKVVIAQYLTVTESFHDSKEIGFVNRLLDRLARELRPEAFGLAAPAAGA